MKRKTIKVAAFILIACITACKKPAATAVYLNTDFKNYFDYQVGSYWIFYDSISATTDSLYVTSNTDYPPFWDKKTATEQKYINMVDSNLTSKNSTSWQLFLTSMFDSYLNINGPADSSIVIPLTKDMPFDSTKINNNDGFYQCILLSQYSFNGANYTDVYKIHHNENSYVDELHLNYQYGFINFLLNDQYYNQSLFLIRSYIVR